MMRKTITLLFAGILSFVLSVDAQAVPITFDLTYSGASFGNSAAGTGSVTIDDAVLPNPGALANVTAAALGVSAFSITISGANAGNGTFGLADVTNWIWDASQPLDLTQELVGQTGFNDFNWCAINFVGCIPPAPGGVSAFNIRSNAETGDQLVLTSMVQAPVPEPSAAILYGVGLTVVGWRSRRRPA